MSPTANEPDRRSPQRKADDERIAAEPPFPMPDIPPGTTPRPIEAFHPRPHRRPIAVAGVVENGMVRLLDPDVTLADDTRVVVVAAGN